MMKRASARLALLVFCLGLGQLALAQPRQIDKVVAIVDDSVILKSELDGRLAQVRQQIRERNMASPPPAELQQQVLDQLILEALQLQMAERAGIRIDDNMLNQALNNIAQSNGLSFDEFRQILEAQDMYLQTREDLAREITIGQFQNRAVNSRIDITRQEIENYLRSETGQAAIAPEYRVAHLLIPAGGAPEDRRAELADLLYKELQEGADILAFAGAGAISGMQVSGGELGWRKPEALPSQFQPVVPGMRAGEVSEPFTSPSGHHIVQVLETRGGTSLNVEQTHLRHILITPNEIRTEDQARQLVWSLYERIQNGENFADIARQHTDDPNSIVAGGDLDWVGPGQLPEDFMAEVDAMEVGEISEPFRVSTGWHIVEVLDRREQDMTEENKRFRAQQVLRERKFEMELQNWLTQIRDEAYVDIKEENL